MRGSTRSSGNPRWRSMRPCSREAWSGRPGGAASAPCSSWPCCIRRPATRAAGRPPRRRRRRDGTLRSLGVDAVRFPRWNGCRETGPCRSAGRSHCGVGSAGGRPEPAADHRPVHALMQSPPTSWTAVYRCTAWADRCDQGGARHLPDRWGYQRSRRSRSRASSPCAATFCDVFPRGSVPPDRPRRRFDRGHLDHRTRHHGPARTLERLDLLCERATDVVDGSGWTSDDCAAAASSAVDDLPKSPSRSGTTSTDSMTSRAYSAWRTSSRRPGSSPGGHGVDASSGEAEDTIEPTGGAEPAVRPGRAGSRSDLLERDGGRGDRVLSYPRRLQPFRRTPAGVFQGEGPPGIWNVRLDLPHGFHYGGVRAIVRDARLRRVREPGASTAADPGQFSRPARWMPSSTWSPVISWSTGTWHRLVRGAPGDGRRRR